VEVETAVRKHLIADSAVNGYVAGKVYKYRLELPIDGTGGRALVVRRLGGWTNPDVVKTSEYPLVALHCYSDHQRDSAQGIVTQDGEEGAWALYRTVDAVMHAVRDEWWPDANGLSVITCARYSEPSLIAVRDVEAAVVEVRYAMQVKH
jgi:hypothetical protein